MKLYLSAPNSLWTLKGNSWEMTEDLLENGVLRYILTFKYKGTSTDLNWFEKYRHRVRKFYFSPQVDGEYPDDENYETVIDLNLLELIWIDSWNFRQTVKVVFYRFDYKDKVVNWKKEGF